MGTVLGRAAERVLRERTSAALALEEARDYVQIAAARREAADSGARLRRLTAWTLVACLAKRSSGWIPTMTSCLGQPME